MITLTGKKVSEGIVIGRLVFLERNEKDVRRIYVEDEEKELARFGKAKQKTRDELQRLYERAAAEVGEANAMMFEIQQTVLEEEEFTGGIIRTIKEQKLNAEYAVKIVTERFLKVFSARPESYVRGHEADILDVETRILRVLARSRKSRRFMDEPFILAARELYPSEAVQLDKTQVLGFVTMYGSINSHTAVLARTKGIPSAVGIGEALKPDYEGKMAILDGFEGRIYIEPDQSTLEQMKEKKKNTLLQAETLERLKGKENVTQSGQKIDVCANISAHKDIEQAMLNDANGIGVFRSEFLYLENGGKLPAEDQQFQAYKLAVEAMGTKKVVIRTADLGGEKKAEGLEIPEEANPMMGYRGIRISLDKKEMFKTQLRAILKASAFGNIGVMFPMVTSVEEVTAAKKVLEKAKEELREEKTAFDEHIKVGVMIETPAAVMLSGELAREVNFFSIGTNDLTQHTLAMDRHNRKLTGCYNPYHPAVMKMIRIVANNVHLEGKHISICGDLASDTRLTEMFIQMGIDELSVAPGQVLPIRKRIREIR